MKKILLFLSFLLTSIGVFGQATLPVDYTFSGGQSSLPAGVSQNGLGSDYATQHSPYLLKFDGTGDYLQIQVNGAAQQIIFGVKKAGGAGNSSIQVSGSANGSVWTNIQNFTINGAQNAIVNCTTSVSINSSYRYFKFTFTKATNGNIGFGILKISSATAPTTYTVSYDPNGGSGTMSDGTGTSVTIANNSFTAPDACHEFGKWNTQSNGNGTDYNPGTVVTSNLTLYAQWKNKTNPPLYTVSFNTSDSPRSQTDCGGSVTLPTPTVSSACSALGWSFAGWSESNSDYSSLKKDTYIPTSNITLYAVYKKSDSDATGYILVEEDLDDWSGDYLIAYSSTIFADGREGGTSGIGAQSNQVNPSTNLSGKVIDSDWGDTYYITLEEISDGSNTYVLKTQDGKYNYHTNNTGNGLSNTENKATAAAYPITVTFTSSSDIKLCLGGNATGSVFRWNNGSIGSGGQVFRFYKNCTQSPIYLYKKQGGSTEYSFNPVCETVHVDTVTLPIDTIRIHINDTYELTPTVLPSNATNKNVSWMSTMSSIATVENGVVTGVAEGTAAAIVVTEDGNKYAACIVIVLGNANIDVVEWNPDWLKIDIENFTAVTAVLEDQNTQADVKQKFANDLFFSKYFEAGGYNKMLAIYNGTKDTINLKQYTFRIAKINTTPVNLGNYGNYQDTLMLPNTEILFVHYDETNSAKDCADDIEGYQNWIEVPGSGNLYSHMNFGGRASIGLYKNSSLIDIIGIHDGSEPLQMDKPCTYAKIEGLNDDVGFYTYNGDNIKTEEVENDYFLSTNRCMLVRKNTVKDGSNAVTRNYHNGANDECNDTIALQFKTLSQEWMGYQIGNGNNSQALTDSTCTGLAYAGHYDYTDYYVAFDTIYTEKPIPGKEEDGFYKIDILQLDTLACTNLKITVKDASNDVLEEVVKIPIMIKTNTTTDNTDYFDKKDCDKCDVVVLKDKTLTTHGTKANRNMKLYEGAELVVDNSSTYTLNSLSFRRYNDSISSLYMNGGTLNVTDKVYFDLYITPDDWHYIALPTSYTISNVKYVNGNIPVYGEDYLVRHYDGKYRAENLKGGWKNTPLDSTFNAGNGFIFGLSDNHKKKEFRFEFNNSVITDESSNKTVNELHAWGGNKTDEELRPNHKGWNLIGNPFLGHFNAEIFDKIRIDSLVKVIENGKWTGQWELSNTTRGKSLRYAVIPSDAPEDRDAGGYKSVVLDDMKLLPFTCFFVQIGGNDESAKGIEFKASRRSNRIVARNYQEDEDDELFLRVKVDNWKTGCFISNKFSDKYEPGDDLESYYPIYQSIGGYKLLYSAISDSIIEHGVQVTTPQGTLYLDPKVNVNKFEYIYVNYNDSWFDLMHGETVNIESGSFILQAKRKGNNVATGLDAIPTNGVYKFSDGNNIYINRNNTIFNIIGSKVK